MPGAEGRTTATTSSRLGSTAGDRGGRRQLTAEWVDGGDRPDDDAGDVGPTPDAAQGRHAVPDRDGRAVYKTQREVARGAGQIARRAGRDAAEHTGADPDRDGGVRAVEEADVAGPRADADDPSDQAVGGDDREVGLDPVALADVDGDLPATGDRGVGRDHAGRDQVSGTGRGRGEEPAGGVVLGQPRLGLGEPGAEDRVLLLEPGAVAPVDPGDRPLDRSDRGGGERPGAVREPRTREVEHDGDDGREEEHHEEAPTGEERHRYSLVTSTRCSAPNSSTHRPAPRATLRRGSPATWTGTPSS